jgi:hypothetical protein
MNRETQYHLCIALSIHYLFIRPNANPVNRSLAAYMASCIRSSPGLFLGNELAQTLARSQENPWDAKGVDDFDIAREKRPCGTAHVALSPKVACIAGWAVCTPAGDVALQLHAQFQPESARGWLIASRHVP